MTHTKSRQDVPVARLEELRRRVFELQALVAKRKTADQALCCLQLAIHQRERRTEEAPHTKGQMVDGEAEQVSDTQSGPCA